MSLIRLAIRMAAVRALSGVTLAEDRVFDSAIEPIENFAKDENPRPVIVVTTDDDEADITGRDLMGAETRRLDLVIEFIIAGSTTAGEITVPHTDAGMEVILDVLQRQIYRALLSGETPWAEDFKRMAPRFLRVLSRRGASAEDGVRFAARQLTLTVDTIHDPEPGVAMADGHVLKTFAQRLIDSAAEGQTIGQLILSEATGAPITDNDRILADLGMTREAARSVRLGSYIIDGEPNPDVVLDEVIATDEDQTVDHTINTTTTGDQLPDA